MAFTQVPNEALDRMAEISAGALRLYLFLCRCRNQKTGKCFPSARTSAEAIDVHPKNIFKLRKELAAAGWAKFDGDDVNGLFGFDGSKNATANVATIEDRDDGSKNTTDDDENTAIGSKNTTQSSKNATAESQKHYPVVAKTLLDGSKNATPLYEEQYELTRLINKTNRTIPVAVAPAGSLSRQECYALFVELRSSVGEYQDPYRNKKPDFVQLDALYKTCLKNDWPLTRERFTQAAGHYFATPRSSHTLADLAVNFSEFFKHALDRFGKPVANGNGVLPDLSPEGRASVAAAQAWLKQKQEERERTGRI